MPADNRKFYKYNVEGEYFDEDSGIIKEIIYYPDTKEITFTFLDDSQKTVELANLVANTELSALLARYITSDTLDITEAEESTNIEVPESYKNCYIVTRNDISDITILSNDTYSITLSEEMEQVITGFKQNLYVDWVTEFPELSNILGIIKLTNCYPSKKIKGGEDVPTYYVFSATDGLNDFSMGFFYEDDTWNVSFVHDILADKEWVNMQISIAVAEKSKVVANVETTEDTPDLSSIEIDNVAYKVGGGGKLYKHEINISNAYYFVLYSSDNLPLTFTTLGMNHKGYYALTYPSCTNLTNDFRLGTSIKVISAVTIEVYGFKVVKSSLDATAQLLSTISTGGNTITDTVTEV